MGVEQPNYTVGLLAVTQVLLVRRMPRVTEVLLLTLGVIDTSLLALRSSLARWLKCLLRSWDGGWNGDSSSWLDVEGHGTLVVTWRPLPVRRAARTVVLGTLSICCRIYLEIYISVITTWGKLRVSSSEIDILGEFLEFSRINCLTILG